MVGFPAEKLPQTDAEEHLLQICAELSQSMI